MYEYRARCINVVDGDTFDFDIDLGFSIRHQIRVRLKNFDTAEMNSKNATERKHAEAARALVSWLLIGDSSRSVEFVTLRTEKDRIGIYGRYTATVTLPDGRDLAQALRDANMEKLAEYPAS